MAFTINQTGIERGATQLLFPDPPIILSRHMEGGPDRVYDLAINGKPVGVEYTRAQDQAFLLIRLRLLDAVQVATLEDLMSDSGAVEVKITPGDATVITCIFGPRSEQVFHLFNDPIANAQPDGSPLHATLTQYRVDLFLIRME